MKNPLREQLGPSIKDAYAITQMQLYRRYPVPELLIHVPATYNLFIDSIIASAYNDDEMNKWEQYRQDIEAPFPSTESEEEIDFDSSSDEVVDMIP